MKRWVSFIVSVFLVFSCASMNVFAMDEGTESSEEIVETTPDTSQGDAIGDPSDSSLINDSNELKSESNSQQPVVEDSSASSVEVTETETSDLANISDNEIQSVQDSKNKQTVTDESLDDLTSTFSVNVNSVSNTIGELNPFSENRLAEVYVSENGSGSGTGSLEDPVSTINEALNVVENRGTIYLLSDITQTGMVFLNGFSVTIDGYNHTIYRSVNSFSQANDARGGYNPALFEVANGAVLTLKNVFLPLF